MSQRGEKGAAQPRVEKGINHEKMTPGDGTRPVSLSELTHNGLKEWDDTMLKQKEYMRANYQDLQSICPDPMMLTICSEESYYSQYHLFKCDLRPLLIARQFPAQIRLNDNSIIPGEKAFLMMLHRMAYPRRLIDM